MFSMFFAAQRHRFPPAFFTCFSVFFSGVLFLVFASPVVGDSDCHDCLFQNPLQHDSLEELLLALADGITVILIPIIVLGVVYIGFRMVWSGREKNADYAKWKDAFFWSLIGLFFVLGVRGVLAVIQNTLNQVLVDEYTIGECRFHGDGGDTNCKNEERCHNDMDAVVLSVASGKGDPLDDPAARCGCSNVGDCCKTSNKKGPHCE